ncbi:MAG TPA: Bax inhibitor-1 family protein [Candidatus Saccharimonadales bacterium]|nr:Bax inhibitor-1 family protein [Candidatus Saccharimonadales bacterium]
MAVSESSKEIWDKHGKDVLGARAYAAALGVALTWAVFLVAAGARTSYNMQYGPGLVLLTFIISIAGIFIFTKSTKPLVSLIGVSILSYFMGLSIGPVIAYYGATTVINAFVLTVFVTLGMAILGVLLPDVIIRAAGILFVGLLVLLVGYFGATLLSIFGIHAPLAGLDWLAVFIFSAYIWYDWARAMKLPKSLDNAIDASGALIVDIVNLFLTLLRIIGRNNE